MFTHKLPALPFIYRTFIGMVLLTAASSFLTPAAFAASQSTTPPPLIETVCKDTSIRQGWVIVDILTDWHRCKGGLLNPGNVWARLLLLSQGFPPSPSVLLLQYPLDGS